MRKLWLLVALLLIIPACASTTTTAPESLPVIIAFNASPPQISSGSSSTILWDVTGASTVQIDQGIGAVELAGTQSVAPRKSTTYTLTASNSAGVVNQSISVSVTSPSSPVPSPSPAPTQWQPQPAGRLPVVMFDISPNVIDKNMGQKATMRWDVDNAVQVVIQPGFGEVQHQGTKIVNPPAIGVHTYTLKASNGAGTVTRIQTLTVKF